MSNYSESTVVRILKNNRINPVATLPCDRIKTLLLLIDKNFQTIPLTREENGVGICAGAYLAGARPLMVIQSTGLGNMINALESLNITYRIPLPIIASWRGVYQEDIPAQIPLGKNLPGMLSAAGIGYTIIDSEAGLDQLGKAVSESFEKKLPHVALISPKVWEKSQSEPEPEPEEMIPRTLELSFRGEIRKPILTRYEAIKTITSTLSNEIAVSNLGVPSKELYHIMDRELNFYMLGSMGLASSLGLGLALFQRRRVIVLDGDGSLLMNPNILTAIGRASPKNLTIIALDNGAYGSTGNQRTPTRELIDLELLARASGIKSTTKAHTKQELTRVIEGKAAFVHVIVKPGNPRCENIPLAPEEIKNRLMRAIRA